MIRRLRAIHRWLFPVLSIVILCVMVSGLRARRPLPLVPPSADEHAVDSDGGQVWMTTAGPVRVSARISAEDSTRVTVVIAGADHLRVPGLLLYWSARSLPVAAVDSADILVGALRMLPRQHFVTSQAKATSGTLLLYSTGHDQLIGAIAPLAASQASP